MLVIEDLQEMVGLESFLRRLGFDVLSRSKESQVADALLGFQADILITTMNGRNVNGIRIARAVKKTTVPPPKIVMSYSGVAPSMTGDDERIVDALMEIPAAGESAIKLLAQLANLNAAPLLEKYRKFATAKLSRDEQKVLVQGTTTQSSNIQIIKGSTSAAAWDPLKNPGSSATNRTERSSRYDDFLANHQGDLENGQADKVMPKERSAQLMKKLKEDSKSEKDVLDAINAEKLKFAEALFDVDEKSKTKK